MEHKLQVLSRIAQALNSKNIVWAVGASGMLYLNGITDTFHDLDLMVEVAHIHEAKAVLDTMGNLQERVPNPNFKTRHFLEYIIDGVEADVIAGFIITKDGEDHHLPFDASHIERIVTVNGQQIPLQSRSDWQHYYMLLGRPNKAQMCAENPEFS